VYSLFRGIKFPRKGSTTTTITTTTAATTTFNSVSCIILCYGPVIPKRI
jgi:hypothetical protein